MNKLLNKIMQQFDLTTDVQLAKFLEVSSKWVSRLRYHKVELSPSLILKIYDKTGMSIEEIREMAALGSKNEKS